MELEEAVTTEWLEFYEQCKEANDLRGPFWKMHDILGPPEGVATSDPRVTAALAEIKKANAGCGDISD
jgi:hypothetical protein